MTRLKMGVIILPTRKPSRLLEGGIYLLPQIRRSLSPINSRVVRVLIGASLPLGIVGLVFVNSSLKRRVLRATGLASVLMSRLDMNQLPFWQCPMSQVERRVNANLAQDVPLIRMDEFGGLRFVKPLTNQFKHCAADLQHLRAYYVLSVAEQSITRKFTTQPSESLFRRMLLK